jgi:MFS superfamily sulfate permease-like transporter
MWRQRRSEFVLSMTAFVAVTVSGVVTGIFLAVFLALGLFFWRAWRPHSAILGRVEGLKGYHDVTRYPDARRLDGLLLFRWDAPLFFANAEAFREAIEAAIEASPTPVRWVVVAAEPVTDVDLTAADTLEELLDAFARDRIELRFAELKDPVKDRLRQYGLFERIGEAHVYPTLGSVVDGYVEATGVEWIDWEER